MRRIGGIILLAVALLFGSFMLTSANAHNNDDDNGGESFKITTISKQFKDIDLPPKGESLGDQIVFSAFENQSYGIYRVDVPAGAPETGSGRSATPSRCGRSSCWPAAWPPRPSARPWRWASGSPRHADDGSRSSVSSCGRARRGRACPAPSVSPSCAVGMSSCRRMSVRSHSADIRAW